MKSKTRTLYIYEWHPHRCTQKTQKGSLSFSYIQAWLEIPGARPISLPTPLRDESYSGDLVYDFFDSFLPDNIEIRSKIQSKFRLHTHHPLDKCYIEILNFIDTI